MLTSVPFHSLPAPPTILHDRHVTAKPEVSHAVLRKFRSSKDETEDSDSGADLPPLFLAVSSALASRGDAPPASAAAAAMVFPGLAGLPVGPSVGRQVEQSAAQAMQWEDAAGDDGRDAGLGLPAIFTAAPPREWAPAAAASALGSSASSSSYATSDSGGLAPPKLEPVASAMPSPFSISSLSSACLLPAPDSVLPPQPSPSLQQQPATMDSTAFVLVPEMAGGPVPVFQGEAELMSLALFVDEDEKLEEGAWDGWQTGGGGDQGGVVLDQRMGEGVEEEG